MLQLSRPELSFGEAALRGITGPLIVEVTSAGLADLALPANAIALTGQHPDQFSIAQSSCAQMLLKSGVSCRVEVEFKPTRAGSVEAALQILSNSSASPHLVVLSGTGVRPPSKPRFVHLRATKSGVRVTWARVDGATKYRVIVLSKGKRTATHTVSGQATKTQLRLPGKPALKRLNKVCVEAIARAGSSRPKCTRLRR